MATEIHEKQLTLATMPLVRGGAVAELFDRALREIYADCFDRPTVGKARKVSLEVTIKPKAEEIDGSVGLTEVSVEFKVKASTPPQSFSRPMSARNRTKTFGFLTDTDSTFPATGQQTLMNDESDPSEQE